MRRRRWPLHRERELDNDLSLLKCLTLTRVVAVEMDNQRDAGLATWVEQVCAGRPILRQHCIGLVVGKNLEITACQFIIPGPTQQHAHSFPQSAGRKLPWKDGPASNGWWAGDDNHIPRQASSMRLKKGLRWGAGVGLKNANSRYGVVFQGCPSFGKRSAILGLLRCRHVDTCVCISDRVRACPVGKPHGALHKS